MKALPVVFLALLAACGDGARHVDALSGPQAPVGLVLLPDIGGLGIENSTQRIDFGRAPEGMIAALTRELGPGRKLVSTGCPAGIETQLAWGDLVLSFTEERFVGWSTGRDRAGQTCGIMS